MTPQTFTNAPSPYVMWALPVAFAIGGISMGASFGVVPGVLVGSTGFAIVGAMRRFGTKLSIECDARGVSILRASRDGIKRRQFAWGEIEETQYTEKTSGTGDNETTVGRFAVYVEGIPALEVTTHMRDFRPLVALLNERTKHLCYEWVPRKAAAHREVLVSPGGYVKVARGS